MHAMRRELPEILGSRSSLPPAARAARTIDPPDRPTPLLRRKGALAVMNAIIEHGRRKFSQAGVLAGSQDRNWANLAAEIRAHTAGHLPSIMPEQMEVTLALSGDGTGIVQRRGNGTRQETPVLPGTLWLCPIGVFEDSIFMSQPIERVAHVYLPASLFRQFSAESRGAALHPWSIGYIAGLADPLVGQMMAAIVAELERETSGGHLLVDALALSLVARLSLSYGDTPTRLDDEGAGGIDSQRLRRVLEFIEDEIEHNITVDRLAEIACLSRFHFSRSFKKAMGIPPHAYVAERRFSHASAMLSRSERPLAEIAFACGFSSQANFSRAFSRASGMTPAAYRARHGRAAQ